MRGRLFNLPAIPRAAGFALVAVAIIAATLHFREAPSRLPVHAQILRQQSIHSLTN